MAMNARVIPFSASIGFDGSSIQGGRPDDAGRLGRGSLNATATSSVPTVVLASPVVVVVVRCMA
jgi:hypothetical protein